MLDVVIGVGEGDAVEREVGGDRVDEFPTFEEARGVAAGGDQVGPETKLGRVVLDEFLDHAADAEVDALPDGLGRAAAKDALRDGKIDLGELGGLLVEGVKHHGCARRDRAA